MSREIRAIYENGLFRPLDPVTLAEHDVVSLVVSPSQTIAPANGRGDETRHRDDFDEQLEALLFDGPSLPADFSRADVYADHD
jgi:predicted DNA-binding antitoxin AbrB/MazE fold protein